MKDYAELEKRLRDKADYLETVAVGRYPRSPTSSRDDAFAIREAADAISELTKRCEEAEETRAKVATALDDYHFALDDRQHGGVAQSNLTHAVETALDSRWVMGAEKRKRLSRELSGEKLEQRVAEAAAKAEE